MFPATALFMAVAALGAAAPSPQGYDGVEGFTRIDLSEFAPKRLNASNLGRRDDYLPSDAWVDSENYLYTKNGGPCDNGCYVRTAISPDMMYAYSVGSSGFSEGRTLPYPPEYPGGDTIFSVEQALANSWEQSCKDGKCSMLGGSTSSYNTFNWPGACGRNVVSLKLDNKQMTGVGQLQLKMTWAASENPDERDKELFNVLGSYIEKAFLAKIDSDEKDLRFPGHNNRGNCKYTDGPHATVDNLPIKYQYILRGVSATLMKKSDRQPVYTLKLLNDLCDSKTYAHGLCDGLDVLFGSLDFLPGWVGSVESLICNEVDKEAEGSVKQC